jgi:hypothetical protein
MRRFVPLVAAVSTIVFAHGSPVHAAPFQTAARPQLIALADGVQVTPILTAGDVVGDFQYTGVPDGIGVYQEDGGNVVAFVNHELSYRWGDVSWARVSRLALNAAGKVLSGSYAIDGTEGDTQALLLRLAAEDVQDDDEPETVRSRLVVNIVLPAAERLRSRMLAEGDERAGELTVLLDPVRTARAQGGRAPRARRCSWYAASLRGQRAEPTNTRGGRGGHAGARHATRRHRRPGGTRP